MKIYSLAFCATALALASTTAAHAATIVGSDAFAEFNVTALTSGPITATTAFSMNGGVTTSNGTNNLSPIVAGTSTTESATFNPSTSVFSITFGTFGTFTESAAPVLESVAANGGGSEFLLIGTFTPSGTLSTFSAGAASVDIAFTETGNSTSGISYSGSGTLASPPAAVSATPEPSSLILLGTGLAGLAGAARRKIRG